MNEIDKGAGELLERPGLCIAVVENRDELDERAEMLIAAMNRTGAHSGVLLVGAQGSRPIVGPLPEGWSRMGIGLTFSETDDIHAEARALMQQYISGVEMAMADYFRRGRPGRFAAQPAYATATHLPEPIFGYGHGAAVHIVYVERPGGYAHLFTSRKPAPPLM